MKTSIILSGLAFFSAVLAAPQPGDKHAGHRDDKHHGGGKHHWGGKKFTSTYSVVATPNQVVNATADGEGFYFTGGLKVSINYAAVCIAQSTNDEQGAKGYYNFGINSKTNTICYDITLTGFRGRYESAANTASKSCGLASQR